MSSYFLKNAEFILISYPQTDGICSTIMYQMYQGSLQSKLWSFTPFISLSWHKQEQYLETGHNFLHSNLSFSHQILQFPNSAVETVF